MLYFYFFPESNDALLVNSASPQIMTLANQIIAAMPERIKSSPTHTSGSITSNVPQTNVVGGGGAKQSLRSTNTSTSLDLGDLDDVYSMDSR